MYSLNYSRRADRYLAKLPRHLMLRLKKKIATLKQNPVPQNAMHLSNNRFFRIRIGKYRVIYEIDYERKLIGISKIDKRSRAY